MKVNGWVKLHRKLLDNPIWRHDPTAWRVFEALLLLADEKGQWSGGRYQLASITEIKDGTLYDALQRLRKARMVNIATNNKYSVINILNWSIYQQPPTPKPTTNQQQTNTLIRIENKNTNTNVLVGEAYGKPEINEVFAYWEETTGLPITARQAANRRAAANLVRKHGTDTLKRAINGVAMAQGNQYAPRIANFEQLQAKWDDLMVWGRKQTNRVEVIT